MMDMFKVLTTGPMTTVQDLGRFGFQQYGVPVSGGMDNFALRCANLLVGNPESCAVLEMTFTGLKLEVLAPADLAVTGAKMPVTLNDRSVDTWTSFPVKPGDVLVVKPAAQGLRGYLAVTGGLDLPRVMGSRSTYLGGAIGGFQGRALAKGDILARLAGEAHGQSRELPQELRPAMDRGLTLRAVPGPQDDYFGQGLEVFFSAEFKVSAKADRMGYRLEGPVVGLKEDAPKSIISEPSLAGAVQIPADGQPIVLLIEQTVGGYAKIATVVSSDLDKVAQARPGDSVSFRQVDISQARKLHQERMDLLAQIRKILPV